MTEPAGAYSCPAGRIGRDVEDDVIGTCGIAGDAANPREMIEAQKIADSPRNIVVGARSVAAHPDSTNQLLAGRI